MTVNRIDPADNGRYVVPIDPNERIGETIRDAISEVTDRPLSTTDRATLGEVETLYDRVEPDAVDRIFAPGGSRGRLTFYFADCEVVFVNGTHLAVRQLE